MLEALLGELFEELVRELLEELGGFLEDLLGNLLYVVEGFWRLLKDIGGY